jgi:hypothetical protein
MCLVRRLWLPTVADAMAPWLSIAIGIGGRWLSSCCGWGREVAGAPGGLISVSRYRNHVASRAASDAAMYSASHVDQPFSSQRLSPRPFLPTVSSLALSLLGHFSSGSFLPAASSSALPCVRTFLFSFSSQQFRPQLVLVRRTLFLSFPCLPGRSS